MAVSLVSYCLTESSDEEISRHSYSDSDSDVRSEEELDAQLMGPSPWTAVEEMSMTSSDTSMEACHIGEQLSQSMGPSCTAEEEMTSSSDDQENFFMHKTQACDSDSDSAEPVQHPTTDQHSCNILPETRREEEYTSPGTPHDPEETDSDSPEDLAQPSRRVSYALNPSNTSQETKKFLKTLEIFWTRKHNMIRRSSPIAQSTFKKSQERILCYLEFVRSKTDVTELIGAFDRPDIVEEYLDHLKEERQLNPATIANHVTAILYAVKFLNQDHAPKYDIPVVQQLRSVATQLQKEGDLLRPKTREELELVGKWVSWEEFLRALQKQTGLFELADSGKERASCLMDLLLLSFYVLMPPGRALEVRTLEIFIETQDLKFDIKKDGNYAVLRLNGDVWLHYFSHKTCKKYGRDMTILEADDELCRWVRDFVMDGRKHLTKQETPFLFLNRNGNPFSGPGFTTHLQRLFKGLIGKSASVQALRSAFITSAYSDGHCTESLKDAIAAALRHSRKEAQRTYDRRTANEKKQPALDYARDRATSFLHAESSDNELPRPSDFVGLVDETSTILKPSFMIAQVQYCKGSDVHLLWYKPTGPRLRRTYKLFLDGNQWVESADCLVPVSVEPAKEHGAYKLLTKPVDIHKAVFKQK